MSAYIHNPEIFYFRKFILSWHKKSFPQFPWRTTENKWHALVAEIMLQRTKAEQVLPAYKSFSKKHQKPQDYLNDKKSNVFQSLGLFWREKELRKLSKILSKTKIPIDEKSLLNLPGVGNYIKAAFRSLHLDERDLIIDSNVVRIYGRFFGFQTDSETRRKKFVKKLSDKITPKKRFREYNYGLIDYTRTVCATKPLCEKCKLKNKCNFFKSRVAG